MPKPTIYVFAPDLNRPLGGMRMLYRHVDILNANGFQAYIVHSSPKFQIDWFEYSTPVLRGAIQMQPEDIAVYPEIGGLKISEWAQGKRAVIFNQNCYYTFLKYPIEGRVKTPYTQAEVIATIVVSEDSARYLQWAFPKLPIHRIRYSINPKLYYPQEKKQQICFMPRKTKSRRFRNASCMSSVGLLSMRRAASAAFWEMLDVPDVNCPCILSQAAAIHFGAAI